MQKKWKRGASMHLQNIWIYFENGVFLEAKSFGKDGTCIGEAIFNTSLTGYQEIITDPSYAGQFIVFCMPEIGIVGCNEKDMESQKSFAKGVFIRNLNKMTSNFRSTENLISFFKKQQLMGICNVDTRNIVRMLRDNGAMSMIASTVINNASILKEHLRNAKKIHEINYVKEISTQYHYTHVYKTFNFMTFNYDNLIVQWIIPTKISFVSSVHKNMNTRPEPSFIFYYFSLFDRVVLVVFIELLLQGR